MDPSEKRAAAERFQLALDLHEAGVEIMRQNLRRRCPEADETEIETRLRQWLQERPGAEFGDSAGRPIDWTAAHPDPERS